jgi:dTDP-4-dehydrorhamnose reductase
VAGTVACLLSRLPSRPRPRMSSMLRIVVTGTTGKIARSLVAGAAAAGVEVQAVGRPALDLTDLDSLAPAIRAARPDVLVSAAAYTNVEGAESESDLASITNVRGAEALANCARSLGVPIIHLSSSYVYDGVQSAPYRECDPTEPLGTYGRSKLMSERAVAAAHPEHVNLRLSWIYSQFGWNFVTAMLRQAERSSNVRVVGDQIGNPTSAADVAGGIIAVGRNLVLGKPQRESYGTFHLSAPDIITPAAFAAAIFAKSGKRGGPTANVIPITRAEYTSKLRRPANAALDSTKIAEIHGILLPALDAPLHACIEQILEMRA